MAAMERLLAAGNPLEPSAEEVAHENVVVKMVQRELNEADESNLLEEEDMHVFDREPLADRLPLVSCNTCKKPIKASQYSAHAERCRSFTLADDTVMEIDGGANHKKPPRKARKKLLVAQDNLTSVGERERLQPLDADDAGLPDSAGTAAGGFPSQVPAQASFTNSRGLQKRLMNTSEGREVNAPKAGRTHGSTSADEGSGGGIGFANILHADGLLSPAKRVKLLEHADFDVMCAVTTGLGAPCRQPLTCKVHCESSKRAVTGRHRPYDVLLQELKANVNRLRSSKVHDSGVDPLPMTTKVYYLHHHHRMKAVLGNLFKEACARDSGCSPNFNSFSSDGVPTMTLPALALDTCVLDGLQQRGQSVAFDKKMQISPDATLSRAVDQNRGFPGGIGSQNQSDRKFCSTGTFSSSGHLAFGKGG